MHKISSYIILFLLIIFSSFSVASPTIDSLFAAYKHNSKAKTAHQLIDSFSLVYELYDYPIKNKHFSNERFSQMLVYLGMANYCYINGDFHNAERHSSYALALCHQDSLRWLSSCYEVLNVAQQRIGKYQEALQNVKADYDIGLLLKDFSIQSSALNSMAAINIATGHPDEALDYINKAIEIERQYNSDNYISLAIRLGIKSEILMGLQRLDEALECINEAIKLDSIGNRLNKYNIRKVQKSNILLYQEKWEECKNLCLETLDFFQNNNDIVNEIITLKQLGACEVGAKNYSSAEKFLLKGENLAIQISFKPLLWRIQDQLAKVYKETNQLEKVAEYLESSFNIRDSLNTEKYQNLLSEYHVVFETNQKEEQILKQQNIIQRNLYIVTVLVVLIILLIILAFVYFRLARLRKQSNKILKENNSLQNQVYSIVSHDLKNPINAQNQMLDYLSEHYDNINDDDKRNMMLLLQKSNNALKDLLINLLDWSSLESGRYKYRPVRVNLEHVTTTVIRQTQVMCEKKNIKVKHNIPSDTYAFADIGFLEIIIRNLLINAIKYSYENGEIELKTEESDNIVTYFVTDHGKGMHPEEKEFIFKKEYVTKPGTSGETGTGIGLMVCKELVEKGGGSISFNSEYQKGSTFYFTLSKKEHNINK